ncbi:DegV family protein [Eubacterium sp.]|uniref:DegV family protein n=1 Tax=Eubacterium sp. TaxID=142586 RepID=UPI002FCA6218
MTIKIITDSACDMPKALIEEYGVEIMPLYIMQGNTSFKDGVDITPDRLYSEMRKGEHFSTSQIPYSDFVSTFTRHAEAGEAFINLSFSSGLSGTYQTAMLALRDVKEKYPEVPMAVLDTKAVTGGLGMIVTKVAEAASKGADFESLVAYSEKLSTQIRHVFTVTNLEYLYRGGRLNKGTAMVGNLLNIYPLLEVDESGELQNIDKARGEKKLIKKMVDYVAKNMQNPEKQEMYIAHADNMALVEMFIKIAHKHHIDPKMIEIMTLAPIIGTHTGPGSLTVFFFENEIIEMS